jgi:N-acetylglucosamine-6-phosphate deacetylase
MEQIKGFKNSWILTEEGLVKTNLIIENGLIKSIGEEVVEGLIELSEDKIVIPGFIDQHIHGAAGSDAMDGTKEDLSKIACALAKEGTTAFLATTMTQSQENIDKALTAVKEYIEESPESGAEILGVHLEGPFISKDFIGAQPLEYVAEPKVEVFKHYEEVSGNTIKLVSMAVEVEGASELVSYLASKGIVASIGHSNAKYADVEAAIKAGASNVTHTYNAQKPIHHREVGTVGSAMLFDELNCEAICDGIHLSGPAIKLLWKNKPEDKFTLITDAMRAKHMPDGVSELGGQVVIVKNGEARLENGTLAGSVLRMNNAVKNVMGFLGTDLATTVKYASCNPAKNLGVYDKMGSIKVGKLANFAIVDKDVNVYQTIRCGKVIY